LERGTPVRHSPSDALNDADGACLDGEPSRIVVPGTDESRDRIIRATNDQTPVPSWALPATDALQRHIEEYFRASDLYYDRRKNHYKNQSVSANKIVSIPYLGQAIMAIALGEPNSAPARPSSLLKSDAEYRRAFSPDYPIDIFLQVVKWMRLVDDFLASKALASAERNNLKYHLANFAVGGARAPGGPRKPPVRPSHIGHRALRSVSPTRPEDLRRPIGGWGYPTHCGSNRQRQSDRSCPSYPARPGVQGRGPASRS
jgi:hypothetical protein